VCPQRNQEVAKFHIRVETLQPFHLGTNKDPMSDVEGPVATLGGEPVIQGTSLKGALRQQIEEYLILNYADDETMKPCIPAPRNNLSLDEKRLIREGKYRGPNCGYDFKNKKDATLCPTCYLLGTMGLVGFVQVPYLYISNEVNVEEMYANRRDRGTNRVADRANRSMQLLPRGTVFEGELEVILRDRVRGWVLGQPRKLSAHYHDAWLEKRHWSQDEFIREFILDRLEAIPRLGGHISKGFGNVAITVTPVGKGQR